MCVCVFVCACVCVCAVCGRPSPDSNSPACSPCAPWCRALWGWQPGIPLSHRRETSRQARPHPQPRLGSAWCVALGQCASTCGCVCRCACAQCARPCPRVAQTGAFSKVKASMKIAVPPGAHARRMPDLAPRRVHAASAPACTSHPSPLRAHTARVYVHPALDGLWRLLCSDANMWRSRPAAALPPPAQPCAVRRPDAGGAEAAKKSPPATATPRDMWKKGIKKVCHRTLPLLL